MGRCETIAASNLYVQYNKFSEILINTQQFSLKQPILKISYAKCRLFCLDLSV